MEPNVEIEGVHFKVTQCHTMLPMLIRYKRDYSTYKAIVFYDHAASEVHFVDENGGNEGLRKAILEYITNRQPPSPVVPVLVDELVEKAMKVTMQVSDEWEKHARKAESEDRNAGEQGTD